MRGAGFGTTFSAVAILGLAFQSGSNRFHRDLAAAQGRRAAAESNLSRQRLIHAQLEHAWLLRQIAERDAARN